MRILHVVASDRFAGVEQYVARLAVAQSRAGHDVVVAGGQTQRMRAVVGEAAVRHTPAVSARDAFAVVRRLRTQVDVVNSHMTVSDAASVAALVGVRGRPAVVATRHIAASRGSGKLPVLYRMLTRQIDGEISISRAVADVIGVPSTVVHTGVESRHDARGRDRDRVVLVAQRLQPEKRTDIAVAAFAESGLAAHGWRLIVAGDGADRSALERVVRTRGLSEAVEFVGFRSDVPALMDRAGLLMAPCPVEGLGLTVLEAMAAGVPVVAADAAGHREILADVDTPGLFPANDVRAAADALTRLAADGAVREEIARRQRDRQRVAFSVEAQVRGVEAAYRDALARRGRTR